MSITRINHFRARDQHAAELKLFLTEMLPFIRSSTGCQSCELLQDHSEPTRIVIVEVWDTVEAHKASLAKVPPEQFHQAKEYLAEPPHGAYYS